MAKRKTTNIQESINEIQKYFKGIEIKENLMLLRVEFPERWKAYPSNDGKIKVAKSETLINEWYYYGEKEEVTIDDMMLLLQKTIEINESVFKKIKLLQEKIEELKKLFQDEDYDRLKTLKFALSKKGTKKKEVKKDDSSVDEVKE